MPIYNIQTIQECPRPVELQYDNLPISTLNEDEHICSKNNIDKIMRTIIVMKENIEEYKNALNCYEKQINATKEEDKK